MLPQPHYGLDIPNLKEASCPYLMGHSVLANKEYALYVTQSVILVADRQYLIISSLVEQMQELESYSIQVRKCDCLCLFF